MGRIFDAVRPRLVQFNDQVDPLQLMERLPTLTRRDREEVTAAVESHGRARGNERLLERLDGKVSLPVFLDALRDIGLHDLANNIAGTSGETAVKVAAPVNANMPAASHSRPASAVSHPTASAAPQSSPPVLNIKDSVVYLQQGNQNNMATAASPPTLADAESSLSDETSYEVAVAETDVKSTIEDDSSAGLDEATMAALGVNPAVSSLQPGFSDDETHEKQVVSVDDTTSRKTYTPEPSSHSLFQPQEVKVPRRELSQTEESNPPDGPSISLSSAPDDVCPEQIAADNETNTVPKTYFPSANTVPKIYTPSAESHARPLFQPQAVVAEEAVELPSGGPCTNLSSAPILALNEYDRPLPQVAEQQVHAGDLAGVALNAQRLLPTSAAAASSDLESMMIGSNFSQQLSDLQTDSAADLTDDTSVADLGDALVVRADARTNEPDDGQISNITTCDNDDVSVRAPAGTCGSEQVSHGSALSEPEQRDLEPSPSPVNTDNLDEPVNIARNDGQHTDDANDVQNAVPAAPGHDNNANRTVQWCWSLVKKVFHVGLSIYRHAHMLFVLFYTLAAAR